MLVESLICGTAVLAIIYDDGIHYTNPQNAYKYYRHFEGIDRMKGLYFSRDASLLGADLRALITAPPVFTNQEIHDSLEYFIHNEGSTYADRLANSVNQIAVSSSPQHRHDFTTSDGEFRERPRRRTNV